MVHGRRHARRAALPTVRGLLFSLAALLVLSPPLRAEPVERIVWSTNRGGDFDVWIMDSAGEDKASLASWAGSHEYGPMLSPDGRSVLFHSNRTGSYEIYVGEFSAEGIREFQVGDDNLRQLTNEGKTAHDAVWAADSETIFYSQQDPGGAWNIWRIRRDGTGAEPLLDPVSSANISGYNIGIDHAGSRLVYLPEPGPNPNNYNIWTAGIDGSDPTNLSAAAGLTGFERTSGKLAISADGWVIFSGQQPSWRSTSDYRIWKVRLDAPLGSAEQVISDPGATLGYASWSPQEDRIIFAGLLVGGNQDIWTASPDGDERVRLTDHAAHDNSPHWGYVDTDPGPVEEEADYEVSIESTAEGGDLVVRLTANVPVVGGTLVLLADPPTRVELLGPRPGADLPAGALAYRSDEAFAGDGDPAPGDPAPGGVVLGWLTAEPDATFDPPALPSGEHEVLRVPVRGVGGGCDDLTCFAVRFPESLRSGVENPPQSTMATRSAGTTLLATAAASGDLCVVDRSGCATLRVEPGWAECPTEVTGTPGETADLSVLATLTTTGADGGSGPEGYTLALRAQGACIQDVSLEDTDAGALFDGGFERLVRCDAEGAGCEPDSNPCAVYTVILSETLIVSLPTDGTSTVARVDLVARVPEAGEECASASVEFLASLEIPPDPMAETAASIGELTVYPSELPACSVRVCPRAGIPFKRGDATADGLLNLTDAIAVLNYLFLGGPSPRCLETADADDGGQINITDAVSILNYLFLGGPPPAPPGPTDCGPDPAGTSDLGCVEYDGCP